MCSHAAAARPLMPGQKRRAASTSRTSRRLIASSVAASLWPRPSGRTGCRSGFMRTGLHQGFGTSTKARISSICAADLPVQHSAQTAATANSSFRPGPTWLRAKKATRPAFVRECVATTKAGRSGGRLSKEPIHDRIVILRPMLARRHQARLIAAGACPLGETRRSDRAGPSRPSRGGRHGSRRTAPRDRPHASNTFQAASPSIRNGDGCARQLAHRRSRRQPRSPQTRRECHRSPLLLLAQRLRLRTFVVPLAQRLVARDLVGRQHAEVAVIGDLAVTVDQVAMRDDVMQAAVRDDADDEVMLASANMRQWCPITFNVFVDRPSKTRPAFPRDGMPGAIAQVEHFGFLVQEVDRSISSLIGPLPVG